MGSSKCWWRGWGGSLCVHVHRRIKEEGIYLRFAAAERRTKGRMGDGRGQSGASRPKPNGNYCGYAARGFTKPYRCSEIYLLRLLIIESPRIRHGKAISAAGESDGLSHKMDFYSHTLNTGARNGCRSWSRLRRENEKERKTQKKEEEI